MSLAFLADQCVPVSIIDALSGAGHTVHLLRDEMPVDSPDERVAAKAAQLDLILISLNGDFADIVSYPPDQYSGIIAIQLHNHPEIIPQVSQTLIEYLERNDRRDAYKGRLLIVEPHRIRVRQ